jgi:hypothetical protein
MRNPACEQIDDIGKTLDRLAAMRLQCCFNKSGVTQDAANGVRCWCYRRDENGADVTLSCNNRVLVIDDAAIGEARYSVRES